MRRAVRAANPWRRITAARVERGRKTKRWPRRSENWMGEWRSIPKEELFRPKPPPVEADAASGWSTQERRVGLVARKLGMGPAWSEWFERFGITFVQVVDNQVVQVKRKETDGYDALQVGAWDQLLHRIKRPQIGHFMAAGVPPKRHLVEFKVTPGAVLEPGTHLTCQHLVPGQLVKVRAVSKGKGTQGVMKRYGFSGGPASHGASKSHRQMGSTGAGQDPGRVWPGKKMAGRMGGKHVTQHNLFVFALYPSQNVVALRGSVPGGENAIVTLEDANKRNHWPKPPPFPTYVHPEGEELREEIRAINAPPLELRQAINEGWVIENPITEEVIR